MKSAVLVTTVGIAILGLAATGAVLFTKSHSSRDREPEGQFTFTAVDGTTDIQVAEPTTDMPVTVYPSTAPNGGMVVDFGDPLVIDSIHTRDGRDFCTSGSIRVERANR